MSDTIAFYSLTRRGLDLAQGLADELGGTVYALRRHAEDTGAHPFDSLPELVNETFDRHPSHVFVAAAGIVVRCIAPHLRDKAHDPAVVCLDQEGRFAVSLLSGHLGGGNDLAVRCAAALGGQAVITTATDGAGLPSLDVLAAERDMAIGNPGRVKTVNGALLDNRPVQVFDPAGALGLAGDDRFVEVFGPGGWKTGEPGVWVSVHDDCPDSDALWLFPRVLMLGVGCRLGVKKEEILSHIRTVFDDLGFSMDAIGGLATVEAKRGEAGLLEAAADLGVKPIFYSTEKLEAVSVPNPSGAVFARMGVSSVCEAAALLLSDGGELLVEKVKTPTVTLAVARRV